MGRQRRRSSSAARSTMWPLLLSLLMTTVLGDSTSMSTKMGVGTAGPAPPNDPIRMAQSGQEGKPPNFVLPLASPVNNPSRIFIEPWTFGNEEWDPVQGAPVGAHPSGSFIHSWFPNGDIPDSTPGIRPEDDPSMYILPPPKTPEQGETVDRQLIQQYRDASEIGTSSFIQLAMASRRSRRAQAAEAASASASASSSAFPIIHPSFVLPLAAPFNVPDKTFIPPWSFGNRKWDPDQGMPVPSGPGTSHSNSFYAEDTPAPFPPGIRPEDNPNVYVPAPPTGVNMRLDKTLITQFKDPRENKEGTTVGYSFRRSLELNEQPSEAPFNTNQRDAMYKTPYPWGKRLQERIDGGAPAPFRGVFLSVAESTTPTTPRVVPKVSGQGCVSCTYV